jgi:hypothetical protein
MAWRAARAALCAYDAQGKQFNLEELQDVALPKAAAAARYYIGDYEYYHRRREDEPSPSLLLVERMMERV